MIEMIGSTVEVADGRCEIGVLKSRKEENDVVCAERRGSAMVIQV